jgi:hypothetical protein
MSCDCNEACLSHNPVGISETGVVYPKKATSDRESIELGDKEMHMRCLHLAMREVRVIVGFKYDPGVVFGSDHGRD